MRNSIPSNLYAIVSVVNLKRLRNISYRTTMCIARSKGNSDLWGLMNRKSKVDSVKCNVDSMSN